MIAVTIASSQEIACLEEKLEAGGQKEHSGSVFTEAIINNREILIVKTGVGRKKAAFSAEHLIAEYSPSLVVSIGAAGALDPGLNTGDTVVVKKNLLSSSGPFSCDKAAAGKVFSSLSWSGYPVVYGNCLTVKRFVHSEQEKKMLFDSFSANVVDMESAFMADIFCRSCIPFMNIRVVSDTARGNTIDVMKFLNARSKSGIMGAWFYLMANPVEILHGIRLRKNISKASKIISGIVGKVVDELG